ncbi:MAG: tetratricopeptide repeat protein, partial [Myxococcota bacterium]|nr:tetratricopeptide repeat protein [Myxococcota bacterium]
MSCAPRHTTLLLSLLVAATIGAAACAPATATERAHALVRRHRDEEAVALLQQRLRAYPDDRPARRLLIALLGVTGDVPAARAQAS